MSIKTIEATLSCDGCTKPFTVGLDAAADMPKGGTLADVVDDHLRGVLGLSYQGEHQLCRECTKKVDDAVDDDAQPTHDEVAAILNKAAGV